MSEQTIVNFLRGDEVLYHNPQTDRWESGWKIDSAATDHQMPHLYANMRHESGKILNYQYIGHEGICILAPADEIEPEVAQYLGLNPGVRLVRALSSDRKEKAYKLAYIKNNEPDYLYYAYTSSMPADDRSDEHTVFLFNRELTIEKMIGGGLVWRYGKDQTIGTLEEEGLDEETEDGIYNYKGKRFTDLPVEPYETF